MKPEINIMSSESYYYTKHRSHSVRFIIAIALLSNCIIWAFVAGLYLLPTLTIWLCIAAVFFTFVSAVEYKACALYYTRHLRAQPEPVEQPKL